MFEIATDLDITVPAGSTIVSHGTSGDVTVTKIGGAVDVTSDNAAVHLQNIGGDVRVELRDSPSIRASFIKGSVELKGYGRDLDLQDVSGTVTVNGTYTGEVNFRNIEKPVRYMGSSNVSFNVEQVKGRIQYSAGQFIGQDVVGPIHIDARSTNVRLIGFTRQLEARLTGGSGDLVLRPGGSPAPPISVSMEAGNIDLALPPSAPFSLKLMTEHGQATNEYGAPLKVDDDGRVAVISGATGGSQLQLTTERGNVTVRKSTGESDISSPPPAPVPPRAPGPRAHREAAQATLARFSR